MVDRIIKADSGNDVVIQNNGGTRKIEVTNSGNIEFVGDLGFTGDTDSKIKLPSAGGIYKSDGSTQVLTESGGSVTIQNATLPSGTMCGFTETTTTPTASQGSDLTYQDLTGSSVDYTPTTGSSYVVYDYTTCITNSDNNTLLLFKLIYDGSEVTNTNHALFSKFDSSDAGLGYKTFTFVLPSWTGQKTLSLKYRAYGTTFYRARIHQSAFSGDASSTEVYTKIYRRTYSVM